MIIDVSRISSGCSLANALSTNSDSVASANTFPTFTSEVETIVSATSVVLETVVNRNENTSSLSPGPSTLSPRPQDIQVFVPEVPDLKHHEKMPMAEPSNVCKVSMPYFNSS